MHLRTHPEKALRQRHLRRRGGCTRSTCVSTVTRGGRTEPWLRGLSHTRCAKRQQQSSACCLGCEHRRLCSHFATALAVLCRSAPLSRSAPTHPHAHPIASQLALRFDAVADHVLSLAAEVGGETLQRADAALARLVVEALALLPAGQRVVVRALLAPLVLACGARPTLGAELPSRRCTRQSSVGMTARKSPSPPVSFFT